MTPPRYTTKTAADSAILICSRYTTEVKAVWAGSAHGFTHGSRPELGGHANMCNATVRCQDMLRTVIKYHGSSSLTSCARIRVTRCQGASTEH
jgi:hypothetical protein